MSKTLAAVVCDRLVEEFPDLSGRVWFGEVKALTGLPAFLVRYSADREERTTGRDAIEYGTLTVELYAKTAATASNWGHLIGRFLGRASTWPDLVSNSVRVIHLLRSREEATPEEQRPADNQVVYKVEVPFQALAQIDVGE